MKGWSLLVDFGEERAIVASARGDALRIIVFDGSRWMPTTVCLTDSHEVTAGCNGSVAERIGGRLGERELTLGTRRVAMRDAVVALLDHAMRCAGEEEHGSAPDSVWITGPAATRGGSEAEVLLGAASQLGVSEVRIVGEPEAVAASVPAARLDASERVAVCLLAPNRCLIAVLNHRPAGIGLVADCVKGAHALDEKQLRDTAEALADVTRECGPVGAVVLAGSGTELALLSRLVVELLGIEPEPGEPATAAVRGLSALALGAVRVLNPHDDPVPSVEDVPTSLASLETHLKAVITEMPPASKPFATGQEPLDNDVQFTVYRPRSIQPGRWYAALVFAHKTEPFTDDALGLCDPIEAVKAQAATRLGDDASAYATASQDSTESIPRGSLLTFEPRVEGIRFNPERRTISWEEPVHMEEFRLQASFALPRGMRRGSLSVYRGVILIADVNLSIRVGDAELSTVVSHARPYRKIFLSYSHLDRVIAEQVEQVHAALGDEPLRDERILRSGEVWNERIEQMIRDAQIFQLFWSTNSMRSAWVTKEWRYALALQRPNFVRPTYWEEPMPSAPEEGLPPAELSGLHFSPLRLRAGAALEGAYSPVVGPGVAASSRLATPPLVFSGGEAAGYPRPQRASSWRLQSGATMHRRLALRLGGSLAALLAVTGAATALIAGAGSGTHPANEAPPDRVTSTAAPRGAVPPSNAEPPLESFCASCRPVGLSCPQCVTASGMGSFDLGAIQSSGGLLTWKSKDGARLAILLEGRLASSGAGKGHVPLPRHSYSDLTVETAGAWSVVIH